MPVRSLTSSVLKWPDAPAVDAAVRRWARALAAADSRVLRIGYIGSYARGDWGVGSDVDIVIVLDHADKPFLQRGTAFDATGLPVPAELLVYTRHEWESLTVPATRFANTLREEPVWVFERVPGASSTA